jgi:putative copper export protein/methionine-rich copper-binding protein CopC
MVETIPPPHARKPAPTRRRLPTWTVPLALALFLLFPARAAAHAHLESTMPASGDTVKVAPRELRLTFSEGVELALSEIRLVSARGDVALAPLTSARAGTVLLASITEALAPGRYTVRWRIVSDDGHPGSGEYAFVIAEGAQGLAPTATVMGPTAPGRAPPPAAHHASAPPAGEVFGVESPLYAAVRWLTYVGLLLTIGAVAFRVLVLRTVRRSSDVVVEGFIGAAARRAASWGLGAAALLLIVLFLRLYAQSAAVHGVERALQPAWVGMLLTHTVWGWGWLLQAAGVLFALVGFSLGRRASPAGWTIALLGVLSLAVAAALSGHAAAEGDWAALAVLADSLHVLGAGGWLGSLLVVIAVGLPLALRLEVRQRGRTVASLIHAFSPTAMLFASLVVVTGVFAAWLHLTRPADLWTTSYGRTLLLKLALLLGVFATGAYNWLRVKPSLGAEDAALHLRRSATVEFAIALLVLAVTAVLVATSPPIPTAQTNRAISLSVATG